MGGPGEHVECTRCMESTRRCRQVGCVHPQTNVRTDHWGVNVCEVCYAVNDVGTHNCWLKCHVPNPRFPGAPFYHARVERNNLIVSPETDEMLERQAARRGYGTAALLYDEDGQGIE